MLGIVKEINGEKKILPLTTDTGTGAPVGTLIQQYKKVPMSGYLYCDGSTFDQNAYPALYMYLGTNVLPDYRECVMVGAEQNTTDTIATHDVYGEGEFKDDQMQSHKHDITLEYPNGDGNGNGENWAISQKVCNAGYWQNSSDRFISTTGRSGNTTHGKQKAVYVYIKATSGLAENQQENVLNDVKNYVDGSNSYSTNEVKTGGKWISGQPIYRKTIDCGYLPNAGNKTVAHNISGFDQAIKVFGVATSGSGNNYPVPYIALANELSISLFVDKTNVELSTGTDRSMCYCYVTIEYTKTTD